MAFAKWGIKHLYCGFDRQFSPFCWFSLLFHSFWFWDDLCCQKNVFSKKPIFCALAPQGAQSGTVWPSKLLAVLGHFWPQNFSKCPGGQNTSKSPIPAGGGSDRKKSCSRESCGKASRIAWSHFFFGFGTPSALGPKNGPMAPWAPACLLACCLLACLLATSPSSTQRP